MVEKLAQLLVLLQQLAQLLSQTPTPLPISSPLPSPVTVQHSVSHILPKLGPPIITKVEPLEGRAGTRVTIFGSGFDLKQNTIYTGLGEFVVASPDGTTLSFTLPISPLFNSKWLESTADYRQQYYGNTPISFPLGFYIKNNNGVTEKPGLFSLAI